MNTTANYPSPPTSPKHILSRYSVLTLAVFVWIFPSGCKSDGMGDMISMPEVDVRTAADSLAKLAYDAAGGPEMWAGKHIPFVRFDFQAGRTPRHHLWNRMNGQYRLERAIGDDTTLVVLFNVRTKEGQAYYNGNPVPADRNAKLVENAHVTFVNDTYWLLMPTKLFDEGVQRSLVPDSSTADIGVIRLTFSSVGYTPDDNYWVWIDRSNGHVVKWNYLLQGRSTMSTKEWVDYETFEHDGMTADLATRKVSPDGSSAIYTSPLDLPMTVDMALFTSPFGSLATDNAE